MQVDEAAVDQGLWNEKAAFWERHIGEDGDRNRRFAVHPVLWRMLGEVTGRDVLDAGCGTGYLSALLARSGARVSSVDYAEGMLRIARERFASAGLEVSARLDDCTRLETVADASQDLLVSNYVLQDLSDLESAVAAFHRVLRPGGRAVLIFGHPCFGTPGGPQHGDDGSVAYRWPFPYFERRRCLESWQGTDRRSGERFAFPSEFSFYHRALSDYWKAFTAAGFACLDFDEPTIRQPYPEEVSPEVAGRYAKCAYSVAFNLRS